MNRMETKIRATQGHSLNVVNAGYGRVTADDEVVRTLVHGTTDEAWLHIKTEGLKRMSRKRIHIGQGPKRAPRQIKFVLSDQVENLLGMTFCCHGEVVGRGAAWVNVVCINLP